MDKSMDESEKHIDLISAYLKSQLKKEDRRKVESLLNSNREFREMFETIKALNDQGAPGHLSDLAPALKQMSLNMFRHYHGAAKGNRELLGLPIYDSKTFPLPEGVRPSLTSTRRLRYKFNNMEIELSLNPMTLYSFEIIGQIDDGSEKKNYTIELIGKDLRLTAETDELQMFAFTKIPAMKYRLNILLEGKLTGIIDIDLC